jgi:hypothetical protein
MRHRLLVPYSMHWRWSQVLLVRVLSVVLALVCGVDLLLWLHWGGVVLRGLLHVHLLGWWGVSHHLVLRRLHHGHHVRGLVVVGRWRRRPARSPPSIFLLARRLLVPLVLPVLLLLLVPLVLLDFLLLLVFLLLLGCAIVGRATAAHLPPPLAVLDS